MQDKPAVYGGVEVFAGQTRSVRWCGGGAEVFCRTNPQCRVAWRCLQDKPAVLGGVEVEQRCLQDNPAVLGGAVRLIGRAGWVPGLAGWTGWLGGWPGWLVGWLDGCM